MQHHYRQGHRTLVLLLVTLGACSGSSHSPGDAGLDARPDGDFDRGFDVGFDAGLDAAGANPEASSCAEDATTAGTNTAGCACNGFKMPNPASANLPNPASYADNGDGTITDKVTGLVWQRMASATTYKHADAAPYCAQQGSRWRLPTRLELITLVDFTVASPGPTIDPVFGDAPGEGFWTSSLAADNPSSAWGVFFDIGYSDFDDVSDPNRVRCVSAATTVFSCGAGRYQVKTAGEVYDVVTGLTWQQSVAADTYTWPDAKAYCAGLPGAWRLPSMKELQTLVDDSRASLAIDPIAFPNTPAEVFWASSAVVGQPYGWGVDFSRGTTINPDTTSPYHVRCVR